MEDDFWVVDLCSGTSTRVMGMDGGWFRCTDEALLSFKIVIALFTARRDANCTRFLYEREQKDAEGTSRSYWTQRGRMRSNSTACSRYQSSRPVKSGEVAACSNEDCTPTDKKLL